MVRTEFLISMWSVSRQGMEIEWLKRRVRVEVALHSRGTDPEQIRDSPRADEKVSSTRPTPRQGQSTTTPRCRSGYHRRTGSQRCRRHRGSAVVQSPTHTTGRSELSLCAHLERTICWGGFTLGGRTGSTAIEPRYDDKQSASYFEVVAKEKTALS